MSVDDIVAFEAEHGVIPAGTFVALRTDWSKRWPDGDALGNVYDGREHCPGWSLDALTFLIEERDIAAVGHETLNTDASIGAAAAGDLQCKRYLLAQDRFQIEIMNNLDQLPATGAILFVAAPRIADANGMPVRAWAIVPTEQ
ncbi:MAG: cyclase family protein [Pirellulales bacterium]